MIERERPDALLPTLGGGTALNLARDLTDDGTLERYGVELIGADYDAIQRAEDRDLFKDTMAAAGLRTARSEAVSTLAAALAALPQIGLPAAGSGEDWAGRSAIIRPGFTMGGEGGGIAYSEAEFHQIVGEGLAASPIGQVLVEESVIGWGEFELEVMRDHNDNVVIVCSIENIDPMGVHTGDSVTVAPQQTLTDRQYQLLRDQAIAVIRAVGVETGGSNIQFAVNPATDEIVVIEMNPRVSRSSALASKATGFPIAKIAARLAVGYALDEIDNDITKVTPASFEPTIDYVVVKWPRFAFEKFPGADGTLSTYMQSVGEAMAIGRTFKQAFVKAMRSREIDVVPTPPEDTEALLTALETPAHDRYELLFEAVRRGVSDAELCARTRIDPWYVAEMTAIARGEDPEAGLVRTFKSVDTCAAEFEAATPYYYSGWERPGPDGPRHEVRRGDNASVVILGSGPNRIGQGIEFDYCCVHAAMTVRASGRDAVMVNCNPETVSTDYDTSDRLYFEPLTLEDVLGVIEVERPEGVIVQFGGQTPLKLAQGLTDAGVKLLGTPVESIHRAEDRPSFGALLDELDLKSPPYATASSPEEALRAADDVGYPLLVRPSYVLGGRAMEICYSRDGLASYLERTADGERPEGDDLPRPLPRGRDRGRRRRALRRRDGGDRRDHAARRGGRRPLRRLGLRDPGDVARPGHARPGRGRDAPDRAQPRRGRADQHPVRGLRQRRAVRDRGQPARVAHRAVRLEGRRRAAGEARLSADARRAAAPTSTWRCPRIRGTSRSRRPCCRSAASRAPTPCSGPEMKSTGEVMGIAADYPAAFGKAQAAAGAQLPSGGTVFISVTDGDKSSATQLAASLHDLGFEVLATGGTAQAIRRMGVPVERIKKLTEGSPNVVERIEAGEVDLVINTPTGSGARADGYEIRRAAIARGIPCVTTMSGASAAQRAIRANLSGSDEPIPLQELHGTQRAGGAPHAGARGEATANAG